MTDTPIAGVALRTGDVGGSLSRFREALRVAKDVGCSHAEITAVGLDAIVGGRLIPERVVQIVEIFQDSGLKCTLHGIQRVNLLDREEFEAHEAAARASLDLAAALGASSVVLHAGYDLGPEPKTASDQQRAALQRLGQHAADLGLQIAVEPLPPMAMALGKGQEDLRAIDPVVLRGEIEAVGLDSVCGMLDISHVAQAMTATQGDLANAVQGFVPITGHVHLHDSFKVPGTAGYRASESERIVYGNGDLHLPLGWGDIDWEGLAPHLAAVRPGTVLVLEIKERYWDSLRPSVERAWSLAQQINAAAQG
ncbi:MAG: sugar phosphate isomerase/epimerase family protein [Pseudomonadota bacterium]